MNLQEHLDRQRVFSAKAFGPGQRTQGIIHHVRKELMELEESGGELAEWVDVILLALDGAWRTGATSDQIVDAIQQKQSKNEARQWPDWRACDPTKAIEHVRA